MSVVSDTGERASLSVEQNEMSGERASTENPASSPEAHSRTAALPREDQVTSSQTTPYSPSPGPVLSVSHNGRRALESSESTASGKLRSSSGGTHHKRAIREREGERDSGREVIPKTTRNVLAGSVKQEKLSPHQQLAGSWGDEVVLLVDRQTFSVNPKLFTRYPNTMLGRMFSSSMDNQFTLKSNEKGEYEVARGITAGLFRAILDYYHCGVISCPSSESVSELRETCDYLMIPFNEKTIKTHNLSDFLNELSNDGARAQFEKYLQQNLLQAMVQCAQKGERECQIVILMEDDVIDWDEDYPPSVGEDHVERVNNSELCRYFKYFENRDIAKDTLREKGLKKIRIGIEGYPTTKEKVRVRAQTGRTEVVYNYIQRPFLRMSWEKDEAKSRHVDFTCVKVKTDIAPDAEAATLLSGNEDNFDY